METYGRAWCCATGTYICRVLRCCWSEDRLLRRGFAVFSQLGAVFAVPRRPEGRVGPVGVCQCLSVASQRLAVDPLRSRHFRRAEHGTRERPERSAGQGGYWADTNLIICDCVSRLSGTVFEGRYCVRVSRRAAAWGARVASATVRARHTVLYTFHQWTELLRTARTCGAAPHGVGGLG